VQSRSSEFDEEPSSIARVGEVLRRIAAWGLPDDSWTNLSGDVGSNSADEVRSSLTFAAEINAFLEGSQVSERREALKVDFSLASTSATLRLYAPADEARQVEPRLICREINISGTRTDFRSSSRTAGGEVSASHTTTPHVASNCAMVVDMTARYGLVPLRAIDNGPPAKSNARSASGFSRLEPQGSSYSNFWNQEECSMS
jgi:hypothetical protein